MGKSCCKKSADYEMNLFRISRIACIRLFAVTLVFTLISCSSINIPLLNSITGSKKSSQTVLLTTSANDIKMVCTIEYDIMGNTQPQEVKSWPTKPGFYRFKLETYCLRAGTYGPTKGSGYQLQDLKGPLAPHIKAILLACKDNPNIKQSTIQSLLWAMLAGTGYQDLRADYKTAASKMLPQHLLTDYIGRQTIAPELIDAAMPDEVEKNLSFIKNFRNKINNANTKFEELEKMAVLTGIPTGKPVIEIPANAWSVTKNGNLWRVRMASYKLAYVDYYIPYPVKIEKDEVGRITHYEILDGTGYSVSTTYKPEKYYVQNPKDGKQYPIWRFEKVIFKGQNRKGEPQTVEINNEGWILSNEAYSMFNFNESNVSALEDNNDTYLVSFNKRYTNRVLYGFAEWNDAYGRGKAAYGEGQYLGQKMREFNRGPSKSDINGILDEGHYKRGIAALGDKKAEGEFIRDHAFNIKKGFGYLNWGITGGTDEETAGSANQPGHNGSQRIANSNRFH